MGYVYTVIFLVGVIYTVVTFFMGGLLGLAHIDGHFDTHVDAGFHGQLDSHIDTHIEGSGASPTFAVFPIKPITVVTFLTVFGGVGMIGTREGINAIILALMAAAAGLIVAVILYKFIVIPLYKAQNTSAVSQDKLIGIKALVIAAILEDGYGTIAYEVNGRKCNAPAQHVGKKAVAQGEEVIIYEIKNNLFYVEPLNLSDKAML